MSRFHTLLALFFTPFSVMADPIIAEFVASNTTTLADEDGDYGDWIEIYNPDETAVNMAGWYLTDDRLVLNKWAFPAGTLVAADGRLLVFADSKNRAVAGSELHANFKLSAGGEYLALVKPDGSTVVTEFDEYPEQITDYSYGVQQAGTSVTNAVDVTSSYAYLIPDFNVSGWNERDFNDTGWSIGRGGIGYETSFSNGYQQYIETDIYTAMRSKTTAYIRYKFNVDDASAVEAMKFLAQYDDGFVAYLNGALLTNDNASALAEWNSSAFGHREVTPNTFDEWDLSGEVEHLVNGTNVLAIHLLNRASSSSDFLMRAKLELTEVRPVTLAGYFYFKGTTPGAVNSSEPLIPSGDVTISVASGVKLAAIAVELSSADPTAAIYYTLDGSEPDETSAQYTSPLVISEPSRLRAKSYEVGKTGGIVAVADYSFLDSSLLGYLADVPVIVMDNFGAGAYPSKGRSNDGNNVVQVARQTNVMSFFDVTGNSQPFSVAPSLESRAGCRVRGSSSSSFPRKPLSVELWGDNVVNDDNDSAAPFGMSSEADWVLNAPYQLYDKSLVHNPVSFEFAKLIGALAPDSKVVVVFQNTDGGKIGLADLAGVYILSEKVERSRAGVEFEKMNDDGSTGGWMIEVNRLDSIPEGLPATTVQPSFHAAGPNGVLEVVDDVDGASGSQPDDISNFYHSFLNFSEPKGFDILAAQRAQVQSKIRAMDSVLWSVNAGDEATGYASVIDVDSWVRYYLTQNFALNQDAVVLSTFLYSEEPAAKIKMGTVWDFDRSYTHKGSANKLPRWASERDWFGALFLDTNFIQAHQDAWQEARRTVISDAVLVGLVETAVAGLRADQIAASGVSYASWLQEVDAMKSWMLTRAQYLDSQYESLPAHSPTVREFVSSVVMTMTPTSGGVVYYTTDGSDPRAWGGGVSVTAQRYSAPVSFTQRTRVTLRTLDGGAWSGKVVQDYYQPASLPQLVVSELDYNPLSPSAAEVLSGYDDADDFEYLEILNVGPAAVDLSTLAFADGVLFDFSDGSVSQLAAGARVLVVSNQAAFTARYGNSPLVAGSYTGQLRNSSEQVILKDRLLDIEFQKFTYDDGFPWPVAADGNGYSLILREPFSLPDHTLASSWRASSYPSGAPGSSDSMTRFAGDPLEDSDGDGVQAIFEHFLGTSDADPAKGRLARGVTALTVEEDGLEYPSFSVDYAMRADDVLGSAEWSTNLSGWDGSSANILLISDQPNGDGTGTKTWRSTHPYSSTPQFFRLRLE